MSSIYFKCYVLPAVLMLHKTFPHFQEGGQNKSGKYYLDNAQWITEQFFNIKKIFTVFTVTNRSNSVKDRLHLKSSGLPGFLWLLSEVLICNFFSHENTPTRDLWTCNGAVLVIFTTGSMPGLFRAITLPSTQVETHSSWTALVAWTSSQQTRRIVSFKLDLFHLPDFWSVVVVDSDDDHELWFVSSSVWVVANVSINHLRITANQSDDTIPPPLLPFKKLM